MGKLWRRLRALALRRRLERDLEEDMAAHREMMGADRRREFGSTLRLREEAADVWGWTWVDQFRQDLAYGARSLARAPGFALTAIAVLAVGIGVNLAEIHLFNAVLHRIHARNPESLCQFFRVRKDGTTSDFSLPAVEFYRRHTQLLSAVISETVAHEIFDADASQDFTSVVVNGDFFPALGITPVYGRLLDARDNQPGAQPAAVLGYAYWQNHYGGDPGIVLRTIRLNGKPVQVVGIAPADFGGLIRQPTSVWVTNAQYAYLTGDDRLLSDDSVVRSFMVGRMKPGVSVERVQAEFATLAAGLRSERPRTVAPGERLLVKTAGSSPGYASKAILVIGTFILLVLLVLISSCANLGNMLLARGLARQREIEIRLAVGAGRWRLIRQLMTESLLLAALASVAALGVGKLAAQILLWTIIDLPFLRLETDWRIVAVCGGLGLVSMLGFGLAPAFQTVKRGPAASGTRKILVTVQVAVSCVLLIFSSFLIRGVERIYRIDVTYDTARMATVYPDFYLHRYTAVQARQAAREITARLQQLPGIDGVTIAEIPPTGRRPWIEHIGTQQVYMNAVDPSYFPLMRLPVLAGHIFGPADTDAVVVAESAARKLWPNESPLGKTCRIRQRDFTVIGVVKDSGANQISFPESVEAYRPIDNQSALYLTILVHTTGKPGEAAALLRSTAGVPDLIPQVISFEADIAERMDGIQRLVTVMVTLGGIASWLALIGIFGLLAFTVAQRTREIGVRMALGARAADVLRCVLGQYVVPFGAGIVAGIILVTGAIKVLGTAMFGLGTLDPLSYADGLLAFAAVAVAASIAPARRALKIDAAAALRWE